MAQGAVCEVSGTTGYDDATITMPEHVGAQTQNALLTIEAALRDTGFAIAGIIRVRTIVTGAAHADTVFAVNGRWFTDIRPAATMIVAALIHPEMKVELEATALRAG